VATRRWILSLLAAAITSLLAGCGGSTANVQNPQPPPQSQLAIAFQPEPAPSVAVGFSENLTAVVTNDPNDYGMNWNVVCQGGANCGTICSSLSTPTNCITHTASCPTPPTASCTAIYTAPSTISANSMVVEIVAYATANQDKNVVAPITISTFNSSLQAGNYVLQVQGVDSSNNPYQFAGVIQLDGQGDVTGGEQEANYASTGALSDTITGGSYFLGNDDRGTITINTNDAKIGQNGVETFAFVYLSASQALISQMDLGSAATGASAAGTMDLQTSTTAPTGGYAFVVKGTNVAKTSPVAFGGVFNIDSPNTISGNGSVTDEILGKKVNATALGLSGTLTTPDQFGAFTLNLMAPFGLANKPIPLQFTGYIVDGAHIKLIETDTAAGHSAPFGLTAGLAIGQGTATGTFTGDSSFSGTYVFGIPGTDLSNSNVVPNTLTAAGLFTADGGGNLNNGFEDTFLDLNTVQGTVTNPQTGAQISAPFTGTYSVDSTGTGRASSTSITFNPEPKDDYDPTFYFYLTGLTGAGEPAALVLEGGDTHYPSVGTGVAYLQSGAAAFSGDYGMSFTQESSGSSETDGTAQLNANVANTPPVSGLADASNGEGQDNGFLGTFTPPTSNAPFSGTLYADPNAVNQNVFSVPIAVDYYFIDPGHGFFVETDLVNATSPEQTGQVSLGYYATRTPVCAGCP